jgi:hypothetical protein
MTNAAQQIVTSYETLGLSLEQIAEVESIGITAVKAILFANSAKYRADIDTKKENDFNETDTELALGVIRRVAQYSEDDHTALKAAMFIRNDKKGRLDVKAGLKKLNINVTVLNEHFAKATQALASKVNPQQQKAIEI